MHVVCQRFHIEIIVSTVYFGRQSWFIRFNTDLGMAKVYRDERGLHTPWRTNKGFWGNPRYASIAAHEGNEQGRRNDMEALAYILIDCLQGDLPWPPIQKGPDGQDDYKPIGRAKRNTSIELLCAGLPAEFATFLRHARSLPFEAKPDYEGMRYMFQSLASRLGYGPDIQYDWFGR
ncbi:kinase-like domain-containing protein [Gautieria morchelliformis]|nr:kinase-like domain-containing protein [Gautieria morchelliformis]